MTELTNFSASTVVVGSLNPLIFSPEWLHSAGAIGPEESAAARKEGIEVQAPNVTSIAFGGMKLVVEQAKFILSVFDEPLVRAKDFPANCFRVLSHTPVVAMGLNFAATLKTDDFQKWHRFGDALAPKQPWGEFLTKADETRAGGLRSMIMERQGAPGDRKGHVRCIIQVAENTNGEASVEINNHFVLADEKGPSSANEVFKILESHWDSSSDASMALLKHVQGVADAA